MRFILQVEGQYFKESIGASLEGIYLLEVRRLKLEEKGSSHFLLEEDGLLVEDMDLDGMGGNLGGKYFLSLKGESVNVIGINKEEDLVVEVGATFDGFRVSKNEHIVHNLF